MLALATLPRTERSRAQRLAGPLLLVGGLGVATVALHLRDPHEQGSWGECPSAAIGIWCPGCGGLRAVNDLTRLRVADAVSSNLLLVALMPVLVFLIGRWVVDAWRGVERPETLDLSRATSIFLLSTVVIFTVARNLPVFGWLAP